jgi:hypothetical protein
MLEEAIIDHLWLALLLGFLFWTGDYYLAQYGRHLYHTGVKERLVFEGLYDPPPELTKLGRMSWMPSVRFLGGIPFLLLGIYAVWKIMVLEVQHEEVFAFLIGGLILYRLATGIHRIRNIALFRLLREPDNLEGQGTFSARLGFSLTYIDLYAFTVLYLLLALLEGSWFLFGGALTCLISSRKQRDWVLTRT